MLITIVPVIGSLLPLGSPHPLGGLSLDPKLIWTPTWPISMPSQDPIIIVHWLKRKTDPDQHIMWSLCDHGA
jgi:hypothetical protein